VLPGPTTLGEVVRDSGLRHGDRTAVVDGAQRLSYRELERRSAALASALLGDGIGRGGHVGLLLPNGIDFVVALFAATRIGAVAAPLSTLSTPSELRWLLDHGDIEILLAVERFRNHDYLARLEDALPGLADAPAGRLRIPAAPRLRAVHASGRRRWSGSGPGHTPVDDALRVAIEARVMSDDPALLVHTSGTSAEPKGVLHRHGAVAGHTWRMAHDSWLPVEGDVLWSPRPWFWVAGLVADLLYTLQAGATFVIADGDDPVDVAAVLRRERVTYLGGPAAASSRLGRSQAFADVGLTAVPLAIDLAGVARTDGPVRFVSDALERRIPATDAIAVPVARRPNLFGMTETLGTHCALPHGSVLPEDAEGTAGPPVPGMEVRLTDLDDGGPVPAGADGRLWVRGENLMLGLHRHTRAEVFDPDGWYDTGDVCAIDERGWVRFRSRSGDVVKISGANVAPLEVERVLAAHPAVRDVAVVGTLVGTTPTLVAAIVPHDGVELDPDDLRRFAGSELSSYKVPRHVLQLDADELPRTPSGKVRKDELRRLVDRRIPTGEPT